MRALRGTWRAVALDLDGTTLNSSHTLSARTVDAIQKIESRLFRDVAVQLHDVCGVNFHEHFS